MAVRSEQYNQTCVMAVDGDLAAENAAALRQVVEQRVNEQSTIDFVVDLEKSEFIDSEGLQTLLWVKRRCEALFGQVKLVAVQENCRKILEITRLEACFECQADLAAAMKMMR